MADLRESNDHDRGEALILLLELLDESARELPDDLAGFLREVLDPHGERTAPDASTGRAATTNHGGCSGSVGRTQRRPTAGCRPLGPSNDLAVAGRYGSVTSLPSPAP